MLQQAQQIQNNLRQVRQSLNNVDTKINQLRQRISQNQRQLSNIAQQYQSHVNEIQQISQNFGQCYQQLDSTERLTQSLSNQPQQFTAGISTAGGVSPDMTGQYQGISGGSRYNQSMGGYGTSRTYGQVSGNTSSTGQSNYRIQPAQYSGQATSPGMTGQYTSGQYSGISGGSLAANVSPGMKSQFQQSTPQSQSFGQTSGAVRGYS